MKRREFFVTLGYLAAIASSSIHLVEASVRTLTPIELPPNFQYPNGITNARNGTLYVGSITSGEILRIDPDGKIETLFSGNDDVFAATSLRLDQQRGILWGCSPDFLGTSNSRGETIRRPHRIFALDTRSGEVLRVILMPDGGFGNDIALDPEGGVYITDSVHPRIYYLSPGASQLQIWAEDEQLRAKMPGLAGITRAANGIFVVNLFSEGKLFKLTKSTQPKVNPTVEVISLNRTIENPDGMKFAPDGSLLLLECAIASGNGRLLRIRNILTAEPKPKVVEVLAEKLDSPVNLTLVGREIWVTEARIRHRLLPGKETEIPERFFLRRFIIIRDSFAGGLPHRALTSNFIIIK